MRHISNRIKVLVVDDSKLYREVISNGIAIDAQIDIVGTASDAFEAFELIQKYKPDVITLDITMPKMSGIEFLRRIMPQHDLSVVVVSSASSQVFDALNAGAIDFVLKPESCDTMGLKSLVEDLIEKIKICSMSKIIGNKNKSNKVKEFLTPSISSEKLIAIGSSTGGTEALFEILTALPAKTPGIVIVQHMPPVFTKMYAERLNSVCSMEVREAKDGDIIRDGLVLIAPGDFQMIVVKLGSIYKVECFKGEKVNGHIPSVDVLFNSVAKHCGNKAIGVILTGMGRDGANGLLEMKRCGAKTIGQDEKSSVVYGMPKVAFEIGAVEHQIHLDDIPDLITKLCCT